MVDGSRLVTEERREEIVWSSRRFNSAKMLSMDTSWSTRNEVRFHATYFQNVLE